MESVLIEVVNDGTVSSLRDISDHYGDDIDESRLCLHLMSMLADLCRSTNPQIIVADISDVVQVFKDNEAWSETLQEVQNLLPLYLCQLPVGRQNEVSPVGIDSKHFFVPLCLREDLTTSRY